MTGTSRQSTHLPHIIYQRVSQEAAKSEDFVSLQESVSIVFCTLQCPNKNEAQKSLATLAVSSFDLPGDKGFPLNNFMAKPANRGESGEKLGLLQISVFIYFFLF